MNGGVGVGQVYEETTVPAEEQQQPRGKGGLWAGLGCTSARLGPWRLPLKAAQMGLSFLAFVLEEVVTECTHCGGLYFFEFVSCSAFLLCIPILIIYCTSLYEKTGKEKLEQLDFWVILIVGIIFFVASIVFSATSDKTAVETAALTFGYFASIAFLVDFVLMLRKKRKTKDERKPENAANTINATENQPLNNQPA